MIKTLDYYLVLESPNRLGDEVFTEKVMEKLNDGYDLFGTPFLDSRGLVQCVVKVDRSSEFEKVQQVIKSFVDIEKGEKKTTDNGSK